MCIYILTYKNEKHFKNNFFEFNHEIKQQISGTAIRSKFAPPYACIYMNKTEADFLKTQELQPFVWLRYNDNIFFIWTHGEAELKKFMEGLKNFLPNLKFTYESSKKRVAFLDLNVSLENGSVTTDLHTKSTDTSIVVPHIQIPSFIVKL